MGRRGVGLLFVALGVVLVASASAKGPGGGGATVVRDYKHDLSAPVRTIKPKPAPRRKDHEKEAPLRVGTHVNQADPVVQSQPFAPAMPSASTNFDGIGYPGVGCFCAPPDTNGEVGRTQYVQIVNEGFQVFDKSTGASLFGPVGISTLWSGFGGVCETSGAGDPVVVYDQLADRWVISQFAGASVPTDECIAVSTSGDATGSYHRYAFHLGTSFFDYPKLSVWPDAYYMSMNVFNSSGSAFLGPQPFAFDRAAMLAGNPASLVTTGITGGSTEETYLPADLDGTTPPPAGAPNSFVEWPSGSPLVYKIYHFHVDWATPANSTFALFATPSAAGFTQLCASCVPQAGTTDGLDALADRLMFRSAYRNFGNHESLVTNYTVSSGNVAGVRWLELRNVTAGPVSVFQESTYQPDTTWRWMGSAAMDGVGDVAVGFSASSGSINPQIRYAGRLVNDPLNTLAQGEATLFAGTGSQTGTSSRWGDYSDLTVDPVDDCTFWYTTEYYSSTSSFSWRTRIGSFKFPSCTSTPKPVLSITKTADAPSVSYGSQVGFTVTLSNVGTATATGLSVSDGLPSGGGVNWAIDAGGSSSGWSVSGSPPSQTLVYTPTTLAAGTSTHAHVVSATTSGSCGVTLANTASFTSTDGGSGQSSASESVVGPLNTVFSQSFDGVSAPALPAGWSATNASGPSPLWVTTASTPDTAPNTAFVDDPAVVSDKRLDSPSIAVPAGGAQLSFRSNYNLESGYDGGVLEISIAGGAFQDVVAAGGSFVSGAYNSTISTSFGNPLAGRQAWSGSSGGFATTTVDLPAAAAGKSVVLRWRMGSDNSVSATGWRVDTISITSHACSAASVAITKTADAASVNAGGQIGFVVTVTNNGSVAANGVTVTDTPPTGTGVSWSVVSPSDPSCSLSLGTVTCSMGSLAAGQSKQLHITSPTTGSSCGTYNNTGSFTSTDAGSGRASASVSVQCAQTRPAQITSTTSTCSAFSSSTAQSLASVSYSVKRSRIFQVNPQAIAYWVQVSAAAPGSFSFTTPQTITTGNFTITFGLGSGSAVYDSACTSLAASFSQSAGNVTTSFNAPAAGTYYLSLRYSTTTVKNKTAPTPTTVHYNFATTGVSGSTAGVDLVQ